MAYYDLVAGRLAARRILRHQDRQNDRGKMYGKVSQLAAAGYAKPAWIYADKSGTMYGAR